VSKRRTSGTGGIHKWMKRRKDPKTGQLREPEQVGWCAVVDLGIVDGKRKREWRYVGMDRKKELVSWLNEMLGKKQAGTLPKRSGLTVEAWLRTWLDGLDVRPRTKESYEGYCRLHLIPGLGSKHLSKLTAADVDRFLAERRDAGLAPRTRHHLRSILRNALKKAVRDRLVTYNVAAEATAVSVPKEEMKTLDSDQVRQLLAALDGSELEAFFVLAVGLGAREGELLGLRWTDIDLERGVLHINRSLQWIHAKAGDRHRVAALVEPKTRTSRRALQLSAPAIEALREHRAHWRDKKLELGERYLNEWDLVFVGALGEPLHPKAVWREWRRVLAAAQLPTIRPHDLRHTAGTLMRERDVDPLVIQQVLGHSNIATTLGAYGHVTPGLRKQAVDAQAAILGG
jgi:integrase